MGEQGAQVLIYENEEGVIRDHDYLCRHGLPTSAVDQPRPIDALPARSRSLVQGETLRWGDSKLEVIWSPGHTPGLVCLYDREKGLLFTSDHLMRRDESQIQFLRPPTFDRFAAYLESVRKLKANAAETIMPGHGRGFTGLQGRLDEILKAANDRLEIVMDGLAKGPAQASELSQLDGLSFKHPRAVDDSGRLWRTAIAQVLTHLVYLEGLGKVRQLERGDQIFWERV
jgi:glyoxylase-like metal-dependent hydrolase (beta-lactamase superfamily II)